LLEKSSLLQFIYLGEASFYHERMNEFLNVAKNLDIKEIGKNVFNEDKAIEAVDQNQTDKSEYNGESANEDENNDSSYPRIVDDQKPYKCQQCAYLATKPSNLKRHIKSKHIKTKHEGIKHQCQQCDYQANWPDKLQLHIKIKHEGIKFQCQQCEYQANYPNGLRCHVKSKH